jgi:hypothetical protein
LNAAVGSSVSTYSSPPWAVKEVDTKLLWRVVAMDAKARSVAHSAWRELRSAPARPSVPEEADRDKAGGSKPVATLP